MLPKFETRGPKIHLREDEDLSPKIKRKPVFDTDTDTLKIAQVRQQARF